MCVSCCRYIELHFERESVKKKMDTHPDGTRMLGLSSSTVTAKLSVDPLADVPGALWCGNDVKRWRHGTSFLEVTNP